MSPSAVLKKKTIAAVLLLLFIFWGQCLYSAWVTGQTIDEAFHSATGYAMLRYNNYDYLGEHPPLAQLVGAFPLLFLQPKFPLEHPVYLGDSSQIDIARTGLKFLYGMRSEEHTSELQSR